MKILLFVVKEKLSSETAEGGKVSSRKEGVDSKPPTLEDLKPTRSTVEELVSEFLFSIRARGRTRKKGGKKAEKETSELTFS